MSTTTRISSLLLASLAVVACNPCATETPIATGIGDFTEVCWITTDAADDTGASDSSASDSYSSGVTSDICEPDPATEPTCDADPQPGKFWGVCNIDDGGCDEGFCRTTDLGSICMPACDDCGCVVPGCFGGTCEVTGACVPACDGADDVCPGAGMICDVEAGQCVWPAIDVCEPGVGELYGPCDDTGGCLGELQCDLGADASICVEKCVGAFLCAAELCGAPSPAPKCQPGGLCGSHCDDAVGCDPGQVCDAASSVCMWPNK